MYNKNFTKCILSFKFEQLFELSDFRAYFEGSGKHMNDLGNEQYCINYNKTYNSNISYYLVLAYLEHPEKLTNNEDKQIIYFLNQNYFYMGFCLPKDCSDIFHHLIN
mgnify:CR=1 FL=1